jgi:hypothetical protein
MSLHIILIYSILGLRLCVCQCVPAHAHVAYVCICSNVFCNAISVYQHVFFSGVPILSFPLKIMPICTSPDCVSVPHCLQMLDYNVPGGLYCNMII